MMSQRPIAEKEEALRALLRDGGPLAVAFSGGTDSALLLHVAREVLGPEGVIALTADFPVVPRRDLAESRAFCLRHGIRQEVIELDALSLPAFTQNRADRCYHCKRTLGRVLLDAAEDLGFDRLAEGSNLDDDADYRPGKRALAELGILSPLREAGLTKAEIRAWSKARELPTWDKPSKACLASRFPVGEPVTRARLAMVERAEDLLLDLGFPQARVRIHGEKPLARIEVPVADLQRATEHRVAIQQALHSYGFVYVALDLEGYRMGSMNPTPARGE